MERRTEILKQLSVFASVPKDDWFYELCFCLLTPQSSAIHANNVVRELRNQEFFESGHDVLSVLRQPSVYIRFHNTKHRRLHEARLNWVFIEQLIGQIGLGTHQRRDELANVVNGFGLKESSHFLRNIGTRGLAILDRHLLTNLVACKIFEEPPRIDSKNRYHNVEREFLLLSKDLGIDMDELDLLFWCAQTGHILK